MKRSYLTLLLVSSICISSYAQYHGDKTFDDSYIHEIEITSELSKAQLYTNYLNEIGTNNDWTYSVSSVEIDGILTDSVGVRIKGGISGFDPKKPFKIDFNEFISGRKFDGLTKLNLHQGNMDPSYMREVIAYDLIRKAGIKTVRTSYAKVFFNGIYEGIYTLVEQINKGSIQDKFASNQGALYKTAMTSPLDLKYEIDSSFRYLDFKNTIIESSNNMLPEILNEHLDVESFMRLFAIEIFVQAVDGPLQADNNYYIYYEPKSKKYVYIPWDYNLSLYGGADHKILQGSFNFIFNRIKQNDLLKDQYVASFCELLQYDFDESRLHSLIDNYRDLLENEVVNDPYYSQIYNFENAVNDLREIVSDRIKALNDEMNSSFTPCASLESPANSMDLVINEIIASNDLNSGIVDPNGGSADWIELYNNSASDISLDGFYLSNDEHFLKHWKFPNNQIIEANSYLIIWADRDIDEIGLHVDFKLNKDRGDLYLSYEDGLIIDVLNYDMQVTNISLARVPNGTGTFVEQPSTFNKTNNAPVMIENEMTSKLIISPNPQAGNSMLSVRSTENRTYQMQIVDVTGQILLKEEIHIYKGDNSWTSPLNKLNAGIYNLIFIDKISMERSNYPIIRID